jgi:hypothetical protein
MDRWMKPFIAIISLILILIVGVLLIGDENRGPVMA